VIPDGDAPAGSDPCARLFPGADLLIAPHRHALAAARYHSHRPRTGPSLSLPQSRLLALLEMNAEPPLRSPMRVFARLSPTLPPGALPRGVGGPSALDCPRNACRVGRGGLTNRRVPGAGGDSISRSLPQSGVRGEVGNAYLRRRKRPRPV